MATDTSLTLEAHARIRSDIIEGRIRPNVHLVAADLAERLSISRTPVREALQLLASQGLVTAAKRGYVVREHTPDEIREIYEVRAALEGMSAALVAERATDEQIATIEALGAHRSSAVTDDRTVIVRLNSAFHSAIEQAAGNGRLALINARNSEHFFNHRIADLYTSEEASAAVAGHARILDAILRRDPQAAGEAGREHVMEALAVTIRKMR